MTITSNADAGDEAMADAPAHTRQESSSSMSGVDVEAMGRFASTQSWGKDGEEEASRSVEGEDEPRKLKSVLTRKPSMAAMPILQDGFASMSESEDDADDDGDDDDEGVCSLSEFAMVLNVAAWGASDDGRVGVDVIVSQLEALRGTVAPEAGSLRHVMGFDVHQELSVRAGRSGQVSIGAIGKVLNQGMARARIVGRDLNDGGGSPSAVERERMEEELETAAIRNISKVLDDDGDGIITFDMLKAKLKRFGVKSSHTDIISIMTQADIEGKRVVKVEDLSRLLATELKQLRTMLDMRTSVSETPTKVRASLDIAVRQSRSLLDNAKPSFGVLKRFPAQRKVRKYNGERLAWVNDDEICAVCLYDRSGNMMLHKDGELLPLPQRFDYFTDVDRPKSTRTIVELPQLPYMAPPPPKKSFISSLFCCFSD